MTTFENLTTIVEKEYRIRKEMERNPRIKIRPTACLHGLTIRPLAPWSVAKTSSPDESYWSSFSSLDRPWLFLNAKKFSTRCLFIFVNPMILRLKHGSRKPQYWQQPKRGQESREVNERLIFLLFKVGRQTQKEKGKWASKTEYRLTRIFERTKVFPTLNFWNQTLNFRRKLLRNKNAFETAIEL